MRSAVKTPVFLVLSVFSIIATACSQEILKSALLLAGVSRPAGRRVFQERLSLFVFRGQRQRSRIFFVDSFHDETGLQWTVPAQEAQRDCAEGSLGRFEPPSGAGGLSFPTGRYTLSLTDLAGNESLSNPDLAPPDFPERAP